MSSRRTFPRPAHGRADPLALRGGAAPPALRRLLRARDGATAVEFGLLAVPFLGLLGASLENGLVYWEQEILQQAVVEAGRQIYTGAFQTANAGTTDPATLITKFRTAVCTRSDGTARTTLFNCANVRVSVTQASTFAAASPVSPVVRGTNGVSDWNAAFQGYSCAGASAIVVVQAAVDVPALFTLLGAGTVNLPNRRRALQAATVFKVEPYTARACS